MVAKSGTARSLHEARQLIVHGHVSIDGRAVTVPGYLVSKSEEPQIKIAAPTPDQSREVKGRRTKRSSERPSREAQ